MGNEASSTASNVIQNIQTNVGDQMDRVNRIVAEKTAAKSDNNGQDDPGIVDQTTTNDEDEDETTGDAPPVIEGPTLTQEQVESKR